MAITNPYTHVRDGSNKCIPLFCTACAWEVGYRVALGQGEPLSYYSEAELRWMRHCDVKGRPQQWIGPIGELP